MRNAGAPPLGGQRKVARAVVDRTLTYAVTACADEVLTKPLAYSASTKSLNEERHNTLARGDSVQFIQTVTRSTRD